MKVSIYTISFKLNDEKYLLINSLSGKRDIVDSEVIELLLLLKRGGTKVKEETGKIVEELKNRGYLTDKTEDEEIQYMENICRFLYRKSSECKDHIIIPTYNCNLRCVYCSQKGLLKHEKRLREKVLNMDEIDKLFDVIVSLDEHCPEGDNNKTIALFGGEPLMLENMKIIKYIFDRGTNLGYKFRITTNGVTLNQFIPLLKQYKIEYFQITVDGPKKIHNSRRIKANGEGTFDDIVLGIETARKNGIPILVRVNVDFENLKNITDLAEFIISKGWVNDPDMRFSLCTVFEPNCSSHEYKIDREKLLDEIMCAYNRNPLLSLFDIDLREARIFEEIFSNKKTFWPKCWGCSAVTRRYIYDPHGKIYTCFYPVGLKKLIVGTYLPKLRFNKQYELWKKRTIFNLPECKKCEYSTLCGGGCAYFAYETKGDLYKSCCDMFEQCIKYLPYLYEQKLKGKMASEVTFSDTLFLNRKRF